MIEFCRDSLPDRAGLEDGLGRLSLPELVELLHRVADEIQLREMERAGQEEQTGKTGRKEGETTD